MLAVCWAATFLVSPWKNEANTDVTHFPPRAQQWVDGKLPYKDVKFEYPPLAVPLIGLPQLVKVGSYKLGFGLIQLAFAFALLALCALAARLTDGDARLAALGVALTPLLLGALVRGYFDFAPVALTMGALVAIATGRTRLGFGVLGLAVMTKGFPLVVAPVAIAWLLGQGERRRTLEGVGVMAAVVGLLGVVVLALSPSGAWYAIHYQTARPLEVESTPASLLYLWDWIAGQRGHTLGSYGSINLAHAGSGAVTVLCGLAFLAALVLLSWRAARDPSARALILAGTAAVACFAVFGKVFSPQYSIWLVPLLAMTLAWRQWTPAGLAAAAMLFTRIEFPARFDDLVQRRTGTVLLVLERNLFAIVLVGLCMWSLWTGGWREKPLIPSWSGRDTR